MERSKSVMEKSWNSVFRFLWEPWERKKQIQTFLKVAMSGCIPPPVWTVWQAQFYMSFGGKMEAIQQSPACFMVTCLNMLLVCSMDVQVAWWTVSPEVRNCISARIYQGCTQHISKRTKANTNLFHWLWFHRSTKHTLGTLISCSWARSFPSVEYHSVCMQWQLGNCLWQEMYCE